MFDHWTSDTLQLASNQQRLFSDACLVETLLLDDYSVEVDFYWVFMGYDQWHFCIIGGEPLIIFVCFESLGIFSDCTICA